MPCSKAIGYFIDTKQGKNNNKCYGYTLQVFKEQIANIAGVPESMADRKNILFTVYLCQQTTEGRWKIKGRYAR